MAGHDHVHAVLPEIPPMLATAAPLPGEEYQFDWGFEVKWDGARTVAYCAGDRGLRLLARDGADVTRVYPELAGLGEQHGQRQAVLDGEIVVLDDRGRPDHAQLRRRMGVVNPRKVARLTIDAPVHLMLFDLMYLDGRPLLHTPYRERRMLLAGLDLAGPRWSTPEWIEGDARRAWATSLHQGHEGVVAKRLASEYQPGQRSPDWIKAKHVETHDVVIGGWIEGRGELRGLPGALLVGVAAPDGLRYVGTVEDGPTLAERGELGEYLGALARADSPFAGMVDVPGAQWVDPRLVAEVTAWGWTPEGRLRHPTWQRLRPDLPGR
ncbi:non-homologous end-joining DNA ligase [Embleya sp. NPDC059237]|uniref:non-homologous end-joining DNA ligase n=1 Tax=Embleya sp. NPDC059237 TaxID=3346784 RepID=UPI00367568D2